MNQPTSAHRSQRNQEKEPYITPELDKQEPLQDITAINHTQESGGSIL